MVLDEARGAAGAQPEGRWALSITLATVAGRAGGHAAQVPAEGQGREAVGSQCTSSAWQRRGRRMEGPQKRPSREGRGRGRGRPLGPTPKAQPAHPWDLTCRMAAGDSALQTSPGTEAGASLHTLQGRKSQVLEAGAGLGVRL